jgi:hypothetical protein
VRVTDERELSVRAKLERYPQAIAAILQMASNLHRPVNTPSAAEPAEFVVAAANATTPAKER